MKDRVYRQGDVLLIPVDKVPYTGKDAAIEPRDDGQLILARGEVTGHHHGIADQTAILMSIDVGAGVERYLDAPDGATLRQRSTNPSEVEGVHLHGPIVLPPGGYRVVIQRQFEHGKTRQVVD
jgi:hypothetical protein